MVRRADTLECGYIGMHRWRLNFSDVLLVVVLLRSFDTRLV